MHFVLFGGDSTFAETLQMLFEDLGHTIDGFLNTDHPLVDWISQNGLPDAVFFGADWIFEDYIYLIPMMQRVHEIYPDLHLVYVNIGLPPAAINQDQILKAIMALGIPIYTFMCDDEDHEQLVQLATAKWPGFNPKHGFTPNVVRGLPKTQV